MTHPLAESSPSTRGRILAALYLLVVTAGVVGQGFIADRLIVANDAARTTSNIAANTSLYRIAFTIFMLEMAAQIGATAMFYDLLKPVNRSVARIAAIIGLTGCGIKAMARLFYYVPLLLLAGGSHLSAFPPAQVEALTLTFIAINEQGAAIALIFFGFESVLDGWLLLKAGYLPRFLGVLSIVGGFGWLTYLWPPLGSEVFLAVALFGIVGTLATIGWLFIRGVDDQQWRERAELAATSIWR